MSMTKTERDIQRKLRILQHAEGSGDVSKTCRCCGDRGGGSGRQSEVRRTGTA
jgi:hypothetical protein